MFIEIYGRLSCPYCVRAITLAEKMTEQLEDCKFEFTDMIAKNISKEDLEPRVGKKVATVPQIFIDNKHIGGCTEFQSLVRQEFSITL
ncbi:Glutaredoxin-1 [Phocoenobacter uteri]|uniref:Glutaredoxin-1 n=1 Tax=Phocoenobacter uteri TaxID=146806 RepID=A0A379C9Z2_9PAST|nr:GrxA family glutaredoxin [Phocoenobacter uteri]MDG6881118.1 glutaredoxin [Phocoenobacter uteri]SUB59140.1 Glutaredoxin-1 [Phocoenobacter uteri]